MVAASLVVPEESETRVSKFIGSMVNIDSRLLDQLDSDEMFLAMHIGKRMNKHRTCFPSNRTISDDCKWGLDKTQVVKKRLIEKGIISVTRAGGGQYTNTYKVLTPWVGIYVGGKIPPGVDSPLLPIGISGTDRVGESGIPQGVESSNEVLSTEVLNNESLNTEVLNRERKWISHCIHDIFKTLIVCIYPHLDEYKHDGYEFEERTPFAKVDPTVKKLLEKIFGAARKIHSAFDSLKRPLPEYRSIGMFSDAGDIDARREACDQIEAYYDYNRVTKTYITTDPEKLPEKMVSVDWCEMLLKYADDHVKDESYDAAYDVEHLQSRWLIHKYYWNPLDAYVCQRYNNRIVFGGEEYLKTKTE